jgi:hypothetical protein
MFTNTLRAAAMLLLLASPLFAQEDNGIPFPKSPDGLRFYMNADKSKWVQFRLAQQFWTRYSVQNPGTQIEGKDYTNSLDFDLRRLRFYMFGQLDNNVVIFTQFGITNEQFNRGGTDGGKRVSMIFHDAWMKYKVIDDKFVVGAGLHYWNGLARQASMSFISPVAFDNPALNWPTLERTDQLARMTGIFAHGQVGKLHYRLNINQPFRSVENLGTTVNQAMFQTEGIGKVYSGYAEWNFLEKEVHIVPFRIGTYLGKKKIFNIGAGFQYHNDVMASRQPDGFEANGTTPKFRIDRHDQRNFAVDLFYDSPLPGNNGALTVYAVGYYNDMGPNYLRNTGVMNLASNPATPAAPTLNGYGNAYPTTGTGTTLLVEGGWLLPKRFFPFKTMAQPYYRYTMLNFEALNSLAYVHDFGVNWYLNGQNAKITFQNRFRPLIDGQTREQYKSLYEFTIQTTFYF